MGNRTIERAIARKLYTDFSRAWRREKRLHGKYGQPGIRRPTFNEWQAMHLWNRDMMSQSTPADVQEYMGLDPWGDAPSGDTVPMEAVGEGTAEDAERGVMTIPIMTGASDATGDDE